MRQYRHWIVLPWVCLAGCTLQHKIEPSDKPFIVNLNVKIDHEIRMKIKEDNQDLLNLEEEYLKKQKAKTKNKG